MALTELLDQDHITMLFQNGLKQERLSSSLLFHGLDGRGKMTAALMLAKILNCTEKTNDFCDRCPSCKKINHFSHPDVHIIDTDPIGHRLDILLGRLEQKWDLVLFEAADTLYKRFFYRQNSGYFTLKDRVRVNMKEYRKSSITDNLQKIHSIWTKLLVAAENHKEPAVQDRKKLANLRELLLVLDRLLNTKTISIDAIRKALGFINKKANIGRNKVFIINDLKNLRSEGTNAFLKGLEEPPRGNQIILIAEDLDWVLPTIRSRCFIVPFKPLSLSSTQEILNHQFGMVADVRHPNSCWDILEGERGKAAAQELLVYFFSNGITKFRKNAELFQLLDKLLSIEGVTPDWIGFYCTEILRTSMAYKYKQISESQIQHAKPAIQAFAQLPDIELRGMGSRIQRCLDKMKFNNVNPTLTFENIFIGLGQLYLSGARQQFL